MRTTQHRSSRGAAAVEFALLVTPMIMMIFGTTELGRAIYTYNTIDKSVRDAARHLTQNTPGDTTAAAEARCLAVHGNTDCTGPLLAPGLTTGAITICDAVACPGTHASQTTGLGSVNLVTVGVSGYAYDSLVEWVVPDLSFSNISATMRGQL